MKCLQALKLNQNSVGSFVIFNRVPTFFLIDSPFLQLKKKNSTHFLDQSGEIDFPLEFTHTFFKNHSAESNSYLNDNKLLHAQLMKRS